VEGYVAGVLNSAFEFSQPAAQAMVVLPLNQLPIVGARGVSLACTILTGGWMAPIEQLKFETKSQVEYLTNLNAMQLAFQW
jgi:uncharacterized membrane protein (DUF441 family)